MAFKNAFKLPPFPSPFQLLHFFVLFFLVLVHFQTSIKIVVKSQKNLSLLSLFMASKEKERENLKFLQGEEKKVVHLRCGVELEEKCVCGFDLMAVFMNVFENMG
jgi:hypothetical protein